MSPLQSGSILGRYELLVRIGRGGMASVWVARERSPHSQRQRLVAIKAMLPELAREPAFRSMFLEEGQLVRSIDHENVVHVHEVGEVAGVLYMTMEWVEGETLRNVIRAAAGRRPIPAEIAVQVVSDAAAGLHAAHELRGWDNELRGIVHCDVSPHNVLIGVDGRAKVLDFGVASALGHLEAGGIKGKPGYMAPEQACGTPIDRRADVYALGIVLYELTTGQQLVPTRDRAEALRLAEDPRITPPHSIVPDYPRSLERIVLTALATEPRDRYQTAQEFEFALQRYLLEERIVVSSSGVSRLLRRVVGQRVERRRELIAAVLQEIDGKLDEHLLIQHPGLGQPELWDTQPDTPNNHHSAVTLMSATAPLSSAVISDISLDPLSEIDADLGSGVPVKTIQPTLRREPAWATSLLIFVVACAALALGFMLRGRYGGSPAPHPTSKEDAPLATGEEPPPETSAPVASSTTDETGRARRISVENLPLEEPPKPARSRSVDD